MPVPANTKITLEFQDNRGYRANLVVNGFEPDISADPNTVGGLYTEVAAVAAAVALASNSKLVKVGWGYDFDYAQEPATETGVYELVMQKARLNGGDGAGGFQHMSIPAPQDALFLTSADNNLVVVNPAASKITAIQAALAGTSLALTPRGGFSFQQFFGGQLVEGKPRVRRVLQGA